ncbi:tetratricopeptide repeat protein, partial [bacterium]|nr:tetratricopeptide repeat protein [bacterium]
MAKTAGHTKALGVEQLEEDIKNLECCLKTVTGADKIEILRKLAKAYMGTSLEKSLDYGQKSVETAKALGNSKVIANALLNLGVIYQNLSNYGKALECQKEALQIAESIGSKDGIAKSTNNIGSIYLYQGDYDKALDNYLISLKLQEEIEDKMGISMALNNIGYAYDKLMNYDKALEYFTNSLKLFEELEDRFYVAGSLNNIGNIYHHLKNYDKALHYFLRSLKLKKELGNKAKIANALNNIGEVYYGLNKFEQALEYYFRSLAIIQDVGNNWGICNTSICIAKIYVKSGDYALADEHLDRAFSLAKEIKAKALIANCYSWYSELFAARGEYSKALEHYKLFVKTKDSIFTEESSKKIAEMQTKYETEKKEKEAEIYRLRNVELAEANLAITEAKEIIEEKNRHITGSIEYARRIQQAVLPTPEKMAAAIPEYFVVYRPKDIVSGDFYWFSHINDRLILAVVDCTGHGVPGAFMSMIGSMLLNVIVNENRETGPAKILGWMHAEVRSALKQHEVDTETMDGMDICLCSIDRKNNRLIFAGASRPLYLVRGTELIEVAGDRKSIGGWQREERRIFTDHKIDIRSGDMIYLS